jgi:O-antigen ligase
MNKKTYLYLLQGGLIASLLIVFLVFKDLLFPFITSKQLVFNILMEILLVFWLVFIWRFPAYRPKKNFITFGLLAYFTAILISCIVSVNFGLSFWGNAERMLGFFHLFHFLIFYLILITVFRTWREWRALLISSVIIATAVSIIGLIGKDVYSTIGNTAYVSGYLIFNIYFCLILFGRSRYQVWRWLYFLPVVIMLIEFWTCHTSGAIIGLFLSVLLLFFLLGISHTHRRWRRTALIIFLIAILGVVILFSQYRAPWFQDSFLRNLTFQKATFQTRLISWKGAAADFKNHPILGTGFGNYAIIFDKHFDPKFFNYATTETYFDRAHNNLIDIISTTGLLGLLAYLSIFAAVLYYLIKKFKANGGRAGVNDPGAQRNLEIIIIIALLAAYFVQNLAVFDSLVTYIGLMIILGFIYCLTDNFTESETEKATDEKHRWEPTILVILALGATILIYQSNIKPWQMFQGVISGYREVYSGEIISGITTYQSALSGTPLDHDGRTTLVNLISANPNLLSSLSAIQAKNVLDYAIFLAEKNVASNPQDSLRQMQLAQILDTAARFSYQAYQDPIKFEIYSNLALEAIDKSIDASPGRVPVYLVKAQMLLISGREEEAIETVEYAINLNQQYYEGYCRLAQFYVLMKDEEKVKAPLASCLKLGGENSIDSSALLMKAIAYYSDQKDYQHALILTERMASYYSNQPEVWFGLAKLYLLTGDKIRSQSAINQALNLDPELKDKWAEFLKVKE